MNIEPVGNTANYTRLEWEGVPLYVYPDMPDWFIPNRRSDLVLQLLLNGTPLIEAARADSSAHGCSVSESLFLIESFLRRFKGRIAKPFQKRKDSHNLHQLNECWFHVTNRCNLSCTHCMFSSGPDDSTEIGKEEALSAIRDALALGCKVFYFTGGEPLVYDNITLLCDEVLAHPACHVVILTNGLTVKRYKDWLLHVDRKRIHFQVSVDGSRQCHDAMRGEGTFDKVYVSLQFLRKIECATTLAMSITGATLHDMGSVIETAVACGIDNVHYLWGFRKGKCRNREHPKADRIAEELLCAYRKARERGVLIDNIEIIKSQVFSLPGTRFDLSNAGWQSLAIGPDGSIYPSPAMVGEGKAVAGHIREGIEKVWRGSPVLESVRNVSLADDEQCKKNPLRFLVGGGDIDHSFIHAGMLTGHDPYVEVYNRTALHLISEEGRNYQSHGGITMLSRMGEHLYKCGEGKGENTFTHSNCVLSLPGEDGRSMVLSFYSGAAQKPHEDIINPVRYDEQEIVHVPHESRIRNYGCGSPVLDADLAQGEKVVDLGCGAGAECFIAAKRVGPEGRVFGIDMADAMLAIAERSKRKVVQDLTFDTIEFKKAFLEHLPLETDSVDVVISNCVVNLSADKRKTFSEIFRILRPGGRIAISDVTCDEEIPLELKYNERLRGECLGGAFREDELFALLGDIGFAAVRIEKRFLYREVQGYKFYSLTYSGKKPSERTKRHVVYRGPFAAIVTDEGVLLRKGVKTELAYSHDFSLDESLFTIDERGYVTNSEQDATCGCAVPSAARGQATQKATHHTSGCMVCGADLTYLQRHQAHSCHFCDKKYSVNALCRKGHFVCDTCHARDALTIIQNVCNVSTERDMIALMKTIRSHPSFPVHGPEHHSLVPAIILTAYRNSGGDVSGSAILTAIKRGSSIAGGACGFMGVCGAAVGVGIAFSLLLQSTPYSADERQNVQYIVSEVLRSIAKYKAPRCCQRDCYVALKEAARMSEHYSGVRLVAEEPYHCLQHTKNGECIERACPLWSEERTCCEG